MRIYVRTLFAVLILSLASAQDTVRAENRSDCSAVHVSHPVASPDGKYVAFLSDESGSYELYLYDLGSGLVQRLTRNESFEGSVSWSPDSRAFVFWAGFEDDVDFEGYRFDLATGSITSLIRHAGNDFDLDWSPDGRRVVFQSERYGNREIFVLELGDGTVRRLTTNEAEDLTPFWSPDGDRIAFASDRYGSRQIFLLDPSSGSVTSLSGQPDGENTFPIWGPDGDRLLITSRRGEQYSLYVYDFARERSRLVAEDVSSGPSSWSVASDEIFHSGITGEGSEIRVWSPSGEIRSLIDCEDVHSALWHRDDPGVAQ